MSVRKRKWVTARGEAKEAWIVDYIDQQGDRHIETFERKKDAEARHDVARENVRQGIHTPTNKSITVAEAADDWIAYVELEGRERSTIDQYRQHVRLHINPAIGRKKLAELTTPGVNAFRDGLLDKLSRSMARKVLVSLKSLLRDAQRRGNVSQNVATSVKINATKRERRKLKVGIDMPTPDEIRRILNAAPDKWRRLLLVLTFAGLRASEARGLRWQDVDFRRGELHIRQRADRYNEIGKPKSEAGERTIPLGPHMLNTLKEWKLACPKGAHDLVFPSNEGTIVRLENIIRRGLIPAQIAAGVVTNDGKAKYTGLHALRHWYASWLINRKEDGGLELPPKVVQERLGHATIAMTMDTYGHLFPRGDDGGELAAAERALLA
jgi:integrase